MQPSLTKAQTRRIIQRDIPWHRRYLVGTMSRIHLPDKSFSLLSAAALCQAIDVSQVYARQYKPERYDCDNFAYSLKARVDEYCAGANNMQYGPAFGIVWGRFSGIPHAVNWAIMDDRKLYFVEPQKQRGIWRPRKTDRRITLIAA